MHADAYGASRMAGNAIRRAGELGWLTDSNVQSSTTMATLQANVAAGGGHADQFPLKVRINKALDIASADSTLTTTVITNATGVANLASNTQYDPARSYGSVDV